MQEIIKITNQEIVKLLSREAKVCKFMTFLGNGTAINNAIIEDDSKKLG